MTQEILNAQGLPQLRGDFPLPLKSLLDAGVHFGHQTKRWNPKMRPYIYGARNGIHIIDLDQTARLFQRAFHFVQETVARGGHLLVIGTKRQAQEIVQEEATRSGSFFVVNRWLGGTLTNFRTIKQGLDRMRQLERMKDDGTYTQLPKKEVSRLEKERERFEKYLGGLKAMTSLPSAVFIIDPNKKIRLVLTYPASTGRNFAEILRTIDSLQLTDNYKVATPVNWKHGEDVIIVPALTDPAELERRFPKGFKVLKPYLRVTPQPNLP